MIYRIHAYYLGIFQFTETFEHKTEATYKLSQLKLASTKAWRFDFEAVN